MGPRRKQQCTTLLTGLLLLIAAAPHLSAQRDVHAALQSAQARQPAPAFHLPDAQGKQLSPSDFRGKVVLLNFWATKCGGCVLELPTFVSLQKTYGGRGYTAVGISVDIPYDGLPNASEAWKLVTPFAAQHDMTYPIVMGDQATIDQFHITAFPDTLLIDKKGRVAATYVGIVSKEDIDKNIQRLLAE